MQANIKKHNNILKKLLKNNKIIAECADEKIENTIQGNCIYAEAKIIEDSITLSNELLKVLSKLDISDR